MGLLGRIIWWSSLIITFTTFVTGIAGNWNDALQTQVLFGLTWQQFAFSIFGITILGVVIELNIKYRRLNKSYPNIEVRSLVSENKRLILEVTNDGFGGDFSAYAKIRSGSSFTDLLDLQWETNGQVRNHIDGGGGTATLLVAMQPKSHMVDNNDPKSPTIIHEGKLQLLSIKRGQPLNLHLYSYKFNPTSDQAPHYECEVEVTITSEPALLKPFKSRPYKIEVNGLNLAFSEMLNSNK